MQTLNGFPVKKMKLSELVKAPWNPRKISPDQSSALQRSLKEFGTVEPVVWNKQTGHIVGGHQRVDALLACGEHETDVVIVDMPEEREQALNIALNRISGDWDNVMLSEVLLSMHDDLRELTGFSEDEIAALLPKQEGLTDPDAIPEVVEPVAKLGDIWQLGEHRLMCGDSTDAGSVALLMSGERCDMIFTDPPYAVNYGRDQEELQKKSGRKFSKSRVSSKIIGDNLSTQECADTIWGPAFENMYSHAKDDCSFYMTMCQGGDQMMMMMMMMMSKNWTIKHELIWVKSSPVFSMGRLDYDYKHEPILFGWKKKHNFYGKGEFKNSVWEINKPNNSNLHPTMKPIALVENALMNSSMVGDLVLDLFLGSGSTLIACEQLKRKCYGMELDPHYCDVIIKRWEDFTGKQAVKIA